MKKIHYTKPSITDLEIHFVEDAIRNGWGEHCYDYINKFSDMFKNYLNVKYAIPTSSCTGALHIALTTLGISYGDEVILPDITWIATASPIMYLGAKPVFVDVLGDTWCINPKEVEKKITPKTKAIIVVHLYGNLVEMDELLEISKKYGIPLIEDAAEGLGSEYNGRKAGSMGDFGVFSFHGTKTVTTGEGGILVTNREDLFRTASILADHGRDPRIAKQFWCEKIGYKYKMSNLQAALGCAQMERVEELVEKKRKIFFWYQEELKELKDIQLNIEQKGCRNSYWMPSVVFGKSYNFDRSSLIKEFQQNNIDGRVFFYPVSIFPMFENKEAENPISYDLYHRAINLPTYFEMDREDIKIVCDIIKKWISKNS